jgi:hypothetical protein
MLVISAPVRRSSSALVDEIAGVAPLDRHALESKLLHAGDDDVGLLFEESLSMTLLACGPTRPWNT